MLDRWLKQRPYAVEFPDLSTFNIPGVCLGIYNHSAKTVTITATNGDSLTTSSGDQAIKFITSVECNYHPDPHKGIEWVHRQLVLLGLPAILSGKNIIFDYKGVLQGLIQTPKLRVSETGDGWFLATRDFDRETQPKCGKKDAGRAIEFMADSWNILLGMLVEITNFRAEEERMRIKKDTIRAALNERLSLWTPHNGVKVEIRPYMRAGEKDEPSAMVVLEGSLEALLAMFKA